MVFENVKVPKVEDEGMDGLIEVQVEDEIEPVKLLAVDWETTELDCVDERRVLELGASHAVGVLVRVNGLRGPGLHCPDPASTPQNPAAATTAVRNVDETILPEDGSPQLCIRKNGLVRD